MGRERYDFPWRIKQKAKKKARKVGVKGKLNVHHIVPKWVAKKYNIPEREIIHPNNAIALEKKTFHPWIHEHFEEQDFIYLAVAYLGIAREYFE